MRRLVLNRFGALALAAFLAAAPAMAQHEPAPAHAGAEQAAHRSEEGGSTTLWKLANFVLLAGILGYFIYKRGGAFFDARTREVRRGIEDAAKMKAEAEARFAEVEKLLASLGKQIEELRGKARGESAVEAARVKQELEREIQKIQAHSEQEIAAAGKAARQELRQHAAELAIEAAAVKIRARLTPDSEQALVDGMVLDLSRRSDNQAARVS